MKKNISNSSGQGLLEGTLRLLSLISILLLSTHLTAQVTITNMVFPQAGDFQYTSRDTSAMGASVTPPSAAAQSWKFTAFLPWQADTVVVVDAILGGASASFPDAEIILPFFGGQGYFDTTGDSLELVGFFGDPGFGVSFLVEPSSSNVILSTPVNFGDIFQDDFSFVQTIDPADFPELGPLLPPFPPIDSIRITYFSHREDTVDAWGSMSTHLGSFDVLRAKSVDYTNLTFEFKSFGFWVDPANIGIEIPFGGLDTAITYNFLNNVEKVPIVSINVNIDASISSVVYLVDPELVTSVDFLPEPEVQFEVFPNPATDILNFSINDQSGQDYMLLIYDTQGKLVKRMVGFPGNGHLNTVAVGDFAPGSYFLNVINKNGKLVSVKKLLIQK